MFGPGSLVLAAFVVLVGVLAVVVATHVSRSPLKPGTVDRFARRQRLTITDANATHVVAALLVTHRWRRAGLVWGLAMGVLWSLRSSALTLHLIAGLLGWFAGAVIAEWRIGRLDTPGARRAATLERRTVTRYLTVEALALAGITATALVALLLASGARTGTSGAWWGWVAYTGALVVTCALTAGAVMRRPSGFVDSDVRDADDALRTHALGVLVGSAIAASYPALTGFALLAAHPDSAPPSTTAPWALLIMVAALLSGAWVAVWAPSARGRRLSTGTVEATQPVHAVPAAHFDHSAPSGPSEPPPS